MSNQQQGQGQSGPNKQPPTDKKEFKKDTKQKKTEADEDMDNGACASKGGSCGSSSDDQEEE